MVLSRSEKEQLVQDLTTALKASSAMAFFSYKTLTVKDSSELRRTLRSGGGHMQVMKKRLFRRVAKELGIPEDATKVEGSIAVAWSDDVIVPAKAVAGFVKGREGSTIEGGTLNGVALTRHDVEQLAALPGMQELRGQVVSVLAGPLRGFAGVLSSTLRGLPGVLNAIADKQGA